MKLHQKRFISVLLISLIANAFTASLKSEKTMFENKMLFNLWAAPGSPKVEEPSVIKDELPPINPDFS